MRENCHSGGFSAWDEGGYEDTWQKPTKIINNVKRNFYRSLTGLEIIQ